MGASHSATAPGPTASIRQITPKEAQPHSHFHDLPAEVRVMIYRLVVISPSPLPARILLRDVEETTDSLRTEESTTFITQYKITPEQPAISRTDRSIRDEVLRIFYTANTFLFRMHNYAYSPLHKWLEATHANYTALARSIRHVALERSVKKKCTRYELSTTSKHVYCIVIDVDEDEKISVRFEKDLAAHCACTLVACGLVKPNRPVAASFSLSRENRSKALEFAVDVERDSSCLNSFGGDCSYSLCKQNGLTRCPKCGRFVRIGALKREIGEGTWSMYERMKPHMEG